MLLLLASMLAVRAVSAETADLVLFNGKVLTVDPSFSIQSTVAIKDGKILAVGGAEIGGRFKAAKRIDLEGKMVMPGFIDAHVHLFGLSHRQIEPDKAQSISQLQAMVAAKAKILGPHEWISGYGWDEAHFTEKRVPTRRDLDEAALRNPVVLIRAGSHSVVGNSAAFRLAGIDATTPEPAGGVIERNAAGEPTGVIRERNDLLFKELPVTL
jgi:predicted amidohydrolase YtcJ